MESGSQTQPGYLPTLMSSYRTMERYGELLSKTSNRPIKSPVNLSALDAYLLQQVTNYLPQDATIIDLAADATCGTSTVCWLSAGHIKQITAPLCEWQMDESIDWRTGFRLAAEVMGLDASALRDETIDQSLKAHNKPLSQVIITMALAEADAQKLDARLNSLFEVQQQAIIFLLPLGAIGSSQLLAQAINFGISRPDYRFIAMRELCPFWAASKLGLFYHSNNTDLPASLRRLQQQYEGNFQFINLVQQLTESELRARREIERERTAFVALQSSISLKYELKRWFWRHLPSPLKWLVNKIRRRPV